MVLCRIDGSPLQKPGPNHFEAVGGGLSPSTKGSDHGDGGIDPVAFLYTKLSRISDHGDAFGVGTEHGDDRKLIDRSCRQPSRHLGCSQTHPGHRDHTDRVSVDRTGDLGLHVRSHAFQNG